LISRNSSTGLTFPALFFILILIVLLAFPAVSQAQPVQESRPLRILLGFKECPGPEKLGQLRSVLGSISSSIQNEPQLLLPNVATIELPSGLDLTRLEEILRSLPYVSFLEEDMTVQAYYQPNDPRYPEQWNLPAISAPSAWDVTIGSSQVTLAVIDTGVDYTHPDLAAKCVAGYNFVAHNSNPMDDNGHGTHVAGIAAAIGNNATGVAGVDWAARIMPIKVLNSQGSGYDSDVASGIRYAADHGAKVINMSLGSSTYSYTLQEAVNYAYNKGVTIIAAAGNDGGSVGYPAACDHVIAVGALDSSDRLASFSSRGEDLDLTAPGVNILSTVPGGYKKMSGTSMASPCVAGCASLVLARYSDYGPTEVETALESGATDLGSPGFDTTFGYGKVNPSTAVNNSQPAPNPNSDDGTWSPPGPGGQTVWYLAEGYTGPGFETYILIENPNTQGATLHAEYVDSHGAYKDEYYSLAGYSRLTLNLNAIYPNSEVSSCINSTNGIGVVVERSMYFRSNGRDDGHCTHGSPELSNTWYFAEGYTGGTFDEYILVLNPWFSSNNVQLTLFDLYGNQRIYNYALASASRLTIHVNDLAPGMDVAAKVTSDNGVVAERAMYFDYSGRKGGSCAMGTTSASGTWFFAEGYTGSGFDEWLLLFNPSDLDRTATVTYRFNDGSSKQANYIVNAVSRYSVHVNKEAPDAEVAIKVESGGDGLIAERAMYFNYKGIWDGGHASEGCRAPSEQWNLAEGYTGSGFESWLLVQNTSPYEAADIKMAIIGNGGIISVHSYSLPPGSRNTFYLNDLAPPGDVSVSLYSTNNVPLVAERAMYFNYGGITGGSCSMGCSP
jgi:subtilisin family serine protease